jgi:DNA-binding transcriptional MerR regulator
MTSLLNNNGTFSNPDPEKISSPALANFSDEPIYNTKAAVRLSGVPAPTLRAWERRYGVLSPERADNAYRLYSERDVAKIRWLREQVERGMSIKQAVTLLERLEDRLHQIPENLGSQEVPLYPPNRIVRVTAYEQSSPDLSLKALQEALLVAFVNLDEVAVEKTLLSAQTVYSVEDLCTGLLEPVLLELGERWAHAEIGVTVEHFATAMIRAQLSSFMRTAPRSESGPLVLASCAPGEHHEIGLLMVVLFMRRQGWRVVYLGQDVPVAALLESIWMLRPALVCLSCAGLESLGGLLEVARQIDELPDKQRPLFSYGGQLLKIHPELSEKLPGYYLGASAADAVDRVRDLARQQLLND